MTNLLNSLWQGAVLTSLIWTLLKLFPRLNPVTRYGIWWVTMLAVALLPLRPLLTDFIFNARNPIALAQPRETLNLTSSTPDKNSVQLVKRSVQFTQLQIPTPVVRSTPSPSVLPMELPVRPVTKTVESVWLVLSLVLLIRVAFSYAALRRMKRTASKPPESLRARLTRIAAAAGVNRSARLLVSHEITAPLALGFVDPVILIPPSIADQSSADEFNHMALHELAHLARFDDLTNLFQQLLIALLPIQPALFWIGRHLNLEREAACDDRVVAVTGTPRPYAVSLTRLAELALSSRCGSLASGAAGNRSQLYLRIQRLLDHPATKRPVNSTLPLLAATIAIAWLFSLTLGATQLIALTDAAPNGRQTPPSNAPHTDVTIQEPDMPPTTLPSIPGIQIRSIPAQPGEQLTVDLDRGDVKIGSWSRNEVRFKIIRQGPDIEKFLQNHQISIGRQNHEISLHAFGDGFSGSVEIAYEITVPVKFDLRLKNQAGNAQLSALTGALTADIQSGNFDASACGGTLEASVRDGNITLHGIAATAQATTVDGNIEAAECQSPLTLSTHNGNIYIAKITGDVNAQTVNGNFASVAVSGAIDAVSKAGNIEIRRFSGQAVKAHATMGNLLAEIDSSPKSNCSLSAEMGNVELNLVRTAAVTLKIAATAGNIDSDIRGGDLNGGGPEVDVSSLMGNVAIHRK
jgi:beta-lactamase regulating signal transducer with metallopeptidase domain/DUF4097 and DUF4098 domain-containing protein YvlB